MSSANRSLHIDTRRRDFGDSDQGLPDFMSHDDVLAYFEDYADRFGVRPHVTFRTEVTDVSPVDGVTSRRPSTGETRRYGAVSVARLTQPRRRPGAMPPAGSLDRARSPRELSR